MLAVIGLTLFLTPGVAHGQPGVGVNVGNIQIDEPLSPGGSYLLPAVGVINTGHDPARYSLRIIYRHEQKELQPPQAWFSFNPDGFPLQPDQSQSVEIRLKLPVTSRPGDYFAFLEAYPLPSQEAGGAVVGIAAATKLNFTVKPSGVFSAAFLWFFHRFRDASPWSWAGVGIVAFLVAAGLLVRYFPIRIHMERR